VKGDGQSLDGTFRWNGRKNEINIRKHGVSFEEAYTVFYDNNAIVIDDEEHSAQEERFLIIGVSSELRMLVVCHCYRESAQVIRLISARKASKFENDLYGGKS